MRQSNYRNYDLGGLIDLQEITRVVHYRTTLVLYSGLSFLHNLKSYPNHGSDKKESPVKTGDGD